MIIDFIINIAYLIGALAFVWGLRLLSSPDTARRGNTVAGVGMVIAIIAAIGQPIEGASNNYLWIIGALVVGTIVGMVSAKKVQMTAMPQI
ncbi:MAG: NAD(P)(+) transhydrogenase (Re/Si-specific) subunit beta, partial [Phaeodactylibacter sp.]|nr:NAD(P)(+) transhydrogenase (Re/Si-specific) subunit beta [Phaeodactylibacter sp.]